MANTSIKIKLFWWDKMNNAGDTFGPYILDKLGVEYEKYEGLDRNFITCGSIIEQAIPGCIIWGSGLHNIGNRFSAFPSNVKAARGKLTLKYLNLDENIPIGDPGVLLSLLYKPKTTKKYKVGLVSHFIDYDDFKKVETPDMPVINMAGNVEEIADKMNECEMIFSSSLHGVIFAHSLGIPAVHIINKPLVSRDSFKFKDYYTALDIDYVEDKFTPDLAFIDKYDPKKCVPSNIEEIQHNLMNAFPFKSRITNKEILEWMNDNRRS